jgi:hypothetical protein
VATVLISSSHLLNGTLLKECNADDVPMYRAQIEDLKGVELHLRCNLLGAISHYIKALSILSCGGISSLLNYISTVESIVPSNNFNEESAPLVVKKHVIEIALKLASAYIELGEKLKVNECFFSLMTLLKISYVRLKNYIEPLCLQLNLVYHLYDPGFLFIV